ncbi:MAG: hypothetical protein NZV14_01485 [Bryobacteraceae bacterium]|nr:hypothetical protein [Bryobacteraceae bacterium]MDW8376802.1 hypothetical protein [Bryobacterales bacterium]
MPKLLIFLLAATTTSVFFINFCNFVFDCGCTWLWAGAAEHCNIHHRAAKACPWCKLSFPGQLGVWLTMVVPQAWISFWPFQWSWFFRLAVALAAFPLAGSVTALFTGIWTGYWKF